MDSVALNYQEKAVSYASKPRRSMNVGFGITYALPVIVSLLKLKQDDLLIIENPEAHLHPGAQGLIGHLIARAASIGAQIIIETHSDHILNGIRVAVKEKFIPAEKTSVFFFSRENVGPSYHTNVFKPVIGMDGSIDYWPDGFFDEWDKALTKLF